MSKQNTDTDTDTLSVEPTTSTNPPEKATPPADPSPAKPANDEVTNADFAKMRIENNKLKKQIETLEADKKERDFAKMSKEQREKAKFEEERAKFEADRKVFMQEKQQAQIAADLSEKGLPKAFAKALAMVEDDEEVLGLIAEAVKEQAALLDSKTKALLAGTPPKVSNNNGEKPITKEGFNKMTYVQKMELYQTDKALYQKLMEENK